jgi:hypothetical protein
MGEDLKKSKYNHSMSINTICFFKGYGAIWFHVMQTLLQTQKSHQFIQQ